MWNSSSVRMVALGASVIASIYLGFLAFDLDASVAFVGRFGYWFQFVAFLLFLIAASRLLVAKWEPFREKELKGASGKVRQVLRERVFKFAVPALCIVSATSITYISQPKEFKVVMDEPVLMTTAKQMHLNKDAYYAFAQYVIGGMRYDHSVYVDKRPLFYPFLVSLLHDWTGYRVSQGIVLNGILLFLLNCLLYQLGARWCPPFGGYLALVLLNSIPVVAINATGAGFDLLNLVLIAGLPMLLALYLRRLDAPALSCLVAYTVLLAQTRYESVLFVLPTACVIAFGWWRQRMCMVTKTMVCAPLLMVLYPLQRLITNSHEFYWQLPDNTDAPFGFKFVAGNLRHAADFLFAVDGTQSNSLLLSLLSILALLVLFCSAMRRKLLLPVPKVELISALSVAIVIGLNFIVLMCYHWGQLDDPVATRLVLPLSFLMVLVVLGAMGSLRIRASVQLFLILVSVMAYMATTRPAMARSDFMDYGITNVWVDYLANQLRPPEESEILILSNMQIASNLREDSSTDIKLALNRLPEVRVHQQLRTFDEIHVVYLVPAANARLQYMNHKKIEEVAVLRERVEAAFELETIAVKKINSAIHIRHARVLDVRLEDSAEELDFDMRGLRVLDNGDLHFLNPNLPQQFTDSLP